MKKPLSIIWIVSALILFMLIMAAAEPYTIVGTGQTKCYGNTGERPCPEAGEPFYGQDAGYESVSMSSWDNRDGTMKHGESNLEL